MKLVLLLSLIISGAVQAAGYEEKKISFTISEFADSGARVYYNCRSVENKVEFMLTKLGARNIDVDCSGGLIDFGWPTPAHVTARFDALSSDVDGNVTAAIESVEFRSHNQCHLNKSTMEKLFPHFELVAKPKLRRCHRLNTRQKINIFVLKEKN